MRRQSSVVALLVSLEVYAEWRRLSNISTLKAATLLGDRLFEAAEKVRSEYCLQIQGTVRKRPEGTINSALTSGEIEVLVRVVEAGSFSAPT